MATQRWLVTGATGQLGGHVVAQLAARHRAPEILALAAHAAPLPGGRSARAVLLEDVLSLSYLITEFSPTHAVHLGAVTAVGAAHAAPELARQVNTDGTSALSSAAAACGARILFASTDMVFDGQNAPYREDDRPRPLSIYGQTKAAAETVATSHPHALAVRLPLMYGFPKTARQTTFVAQAGALRRGDPLRLFTDEYRTPIALIDAARAVIALADSDLTGIIHVAGPRRMSRYDMGEAFAAALGVTSPNLVTASRLDIEAGEPRAEDLSLDGARFNALFPDLAPRPISADTIGTPPG